MIIRAWLGIHRLPSGGSYPETFALYSFLPSVINVSTAMQYLEKIKLLISISLTFLL